MAIFVFIEIWLTIIVIFVFSLNSLSQPILLLQITVLDELQVEADRMSLPQISRFFLRVAIEEIFETEVDQFGYSIELQTLAESVSYKNLTWTK